jgi:hypothetical protein
MVAVNEQEVPVQVTTTALMNPSNPFYTMHIYQAFLSGRFQGLFLIVIALVSFLFSTEVTPWHG